MSGEGFRIFLIVSIQNQGGFNLVLWTRNGVIMTRKIMVDSLVWSAKAVRCRELLGRNLISSVHGCTRKIFIVNLIWRRFSWRRKLVRSIKKNMYLNKEKYVCWVYKEKIKTNGLLKPKEGKFTGPSK